MIALGELSHAARLLRSIRKQRGWTQQQLAQQLRISRRTLQHWETGKSDPNERDIIIFRTLLSPTLADMGWAHLSLWDAIERDERAGFLTHAQAEALRNSSITVLRAMVDQEEAQVLRFGSESLDFPISAA